MTITAASGGDITFDGTKVWLIPYNTGSGTLAPSSAGVTISGATCNPITLYATLISAPALTGVASGYLKVTNVAGTLPSSGIFTSDGFTYTITGAAVRGWIEIVGDDAATATLNRLGKFVVTGAYYDIGVTSGVNTTTYNVPNNGKQLWIPSIEVQGATWTITGAVYSSGFITYTTSATHDMLVGQQVTVAGITPAGMNCIDQYITDLTATTFKVAMADPGSAYTSGGTAIAYELYPCFGSMSAGATLNTVVYVEDTRRGKVFWNTNATTSLALPLGYIRFNHDGTNAGTGGYLPPAGRKIRIPNVIFTNCGTATRNQNLLPSAALGTRYDFTTTGAGRIEIDKATMCWYTIFSQAKSVSITNSGIMSQVSLAEIASYMTFRNVCFGQEASVTGVSSIVMTLGLAGGIFENVIATTALNTGSALPINIATTPNVTMTDCVSWLFSVRAGTGREAIFTLASNLVLTRLHCISSRLHVASCAGLAITDTKSTDSTGLRVTGNQQSVFAAEGGLTSGVISGLSFVGFRAHPWAYILTHFTNVRGPLKLRNMGTPTVPLETAEAPSRDKSWSRTTTTCTVTHVAHGYVVNDQIVVYWFSSSSAITVGVKVITSVPTADTFTFACTNGGDSTGTISYFLCNTTGFVAASAGSNCISIYVQRCYPRATRLAFTNPDNSHDNMVVENSFCTFDPTLFSASGYASLNSPAKMAFSHNGPSAQVSVYGTTWADHLGSTISDTESATWTRSGSTITITTTSGYHNQPANSAIPIEILTSSDEAALNSGAYLVPLVTSAGPTANSFRVTGYAAGAASGTCTFRNYTGGICINMNEGTATNTHYTFTAGSPGFTGAGTLRMPLVGDQVVFESPHFIKGHVGFMNLIPLTTTATLANFHIEYDIDTGSGFSGSYKTAFRQTATAVADGTAGAATIVQVAAGDSWIADGDFIQSTTLGEVHRAAKVSSGGGTTTLTMDKNHNTTFTNRALQAYGIHRENVNINATTGFRLRIRITTLIAGTGATNTLGPTWFRTFMTDASRQVQLPLDLVPITITVKDAATGALLQNARVRVTTDTGGYTVIEGLTNASGVLAGTSEYVAYAISGTVRRASTGLGTLYKTGAISGTITSAGFNATALLTSDE